jgi:hypothetical protein
MNVTTFTLSQKDIDRVDIEIYGSLEKAKKAKAEEDKLWCKCEDTDHGAYYVPDGQHPECDKHHWRCHDCKKIVQIG